MKTSKRSIPLLLLAGVLASFIACAQSDTATVTIDVGGVQGAGSVKLSLFDRVLAILSLAGKAGAQGTPPEIDFIVVTVTGSGMTSIEENIPVETGTVTFDVPSGSGRTFSVVAYDDIGDGIVLRKYGGIVTRDLAPSSSTSIAIDMGPLPQSGGYDIWEVTRNYDQQENPFDFIRWWREATPPDVTGYYLYRARGDLREFGLGATPSDSAFTRIASFGNDLEDPQDYTDNAIADEYVYWYRLSGYNQ
jgi:hypothetical protein